jgi:hypothetical protein
MTETREMQDIEPNMTGDRLKFVILKGLQRISWWVTNGEAGVSQAMSGDVGFAPLPLPLYTDTSPTFPRVRDNGNGYFVGEAVCPCSFGHGIFCGWCCGCVRHRRESQKNPPRSAVLNTKRGSLSLMLAPVHITIKVKEG